MKLVEEAGDPGDIYGRAFERDADGNIVYETEGDYAGLLRTAGDGQYRQGMAANPVFALSWSNTFSPQGRVATSLMLDSPLRGPAAVADQPIWIPYGVSAATADARDRGCA